MTFEQSTKEVSALEGILPLQTEEPSREAAKPHIAQDPGLEDWDAYFQLLLSGRLKEYGGRFIALYQGRVVATGDDPEQLRTEQAKKLNVNEGTLVIPFVDNKECIIAE